MKHEFAGLLIDGRALIFLPYRCTNCGLVAFGARAVRLEGRPCSGH